MTEKPEQLELFPYMRRSYKHSYQDPYNVAKLIAERIRDKERGFEVMKKLCTEDLDKGK